jgi:hypothetical protein
MPLSLGLAPQKSRLGVLLDHLSTIDDPRDVRRIAHLLAGVLLLVVCATMAVRDADADYLLAVKANQPTLRARSRPASPQPCPARSAPTPNTTRGTAASSSAPRA